MTKMPDKIWANIYGDWWGEEDIEEKDRLSLYIPAHIVRSLLDTIREGVMLMPIDQLAQWESVRTQLEQVGELVDEQHVGIIDRGL